MTERSSAGVPKCLLGHDPTSISEMYCNPNQPLFGAMTVDFKNSQMISDLLNSPLRRWVYINVLGRFSKVRGARG